MAIFRSKKKNEIVQIDADWLLGESQSKRPSALASFSRMSLLLGLVAVVVWAWPFASRVWLTWDWNTQLASSDGKPTEDILPILLALNDLNPNQNAPTVQQLSSSEADKRLIAYHLIQQKIERWKKNKPSHADLVAFVDSLQSMPSQVPESVLMRGQLASHLMALVDQDTPNKSQLIAAVDRMIADAAQLSKPATTTLTDAGKVELAVSSGPSRIQPIARVRIADSASLSPVSPPDPPSLTGHPPSSFQPPTTKSTTNSDLAQSVSRVPIESSNLSVTLPAPKVSVGMPTAPNATVTPSPSQLFHNQVVAPARPIKILDSSPVEADLGPPEQVHAAEPSVQGISKLSLDKLMTLLSSTQQKLVQESFKELQRRGARKEHLETLIDLAQGDVDRRLLSMESLVRDPKLDLDQEVVPVLVWMAEQSDAKVRRKAISLLGSLSSQESIRHLRMLKLREPDGAIADQINQVLLAAGNTVGNRR
jgi:hypothetical protein